MSAAQQVEGALRGESAHLSPEATRLLVSKFKNPTAWVASVKFLMAKWALLGRPTGTLHARAVAELVAALQAERLSTKKVKKVAPKKVEVERDDDDHDDDDKNQPHRGPRAIPFQARSFTVEDSTDLVCRELGLRRTDFVNDEVLRTMVAAKLMGRQ